MKKLVLLIGIMFLFTGNVNAQLPKLVTQKIENLTLLEEQIKKTKNLDIRLKKLMLFKIQKSKKTLSLNKKRGFEKLKIIEKKINQSNKKIIKNVLNIKKENLIRKYEKVGNLIQKFKTEGKPTAKLKALQKRMKRALDKLN